MIKISLIILTTIILSGCVNKHGISAKYYSECNEYYDMQGYYHKECGEDDIFTYKGVGDGIGGFFQSIADFIMFKDDEPQPNVW